MVDAVKESFSQQFKDRLILFLIAAIVGTGGNALYREVNPPAPDRFTGTEAREVHARLDKRFLGHERRIDKIELNMENHESRLASSEALFGQTIVKLDQIIHAIHTVEIKIAKLPPSEWRDRIRALEGALSNGGPHRDGT